MMQRRTFINKASFGFILCGYPGFLPALASEKETFSSMAKDIISAGDFKQVSVFEYDPQIDRILSKEAQSLIKMGYTPDNSGYLISADRKQILSLFSITSTNKMPIAFVLKRSGKTWKPIHSIDSFEIQARSKAVKDFVNQPDPAINAENIVCLPKLNNTLRIQNGKPYFVCKTIIEETTAKTTASIVLNDKSIWTNVFRTEF